MALRNRKMRVREAKGILSVSVRKAKVCAVTDGSFCMRAGSEPPEKKKALTEARAFCESSLGLVKTRSGLRILSAARTPGPGLQCR
jgi:hypothetical protein